VRRILRAAAAATVTAALAGLAAPGYASAAQRPARHAPGVAAPLPAAVRRQLPALRQAQRRARSGGRPVTVAAATTQTSVTVARPDGGFATTASVLPVRVRRGGGWVPVSAALRRAAGGYRPAATPSGLVLSAGGQGPLADRTSPAGGRLAFTFPFALPAPSVSGATATYRNVLPGVSLQVTATGQGGFREVLVIASAAAAASPALARLRLATRTRGLSIATDAHGNMTATAPDGRVEFTAPSPRMWDSALPAEADRMARAAPVAAAATPTSSAAGPGPRARVAAVSMHARAGALVLVPDARMLTAAATRWPVYIDPSISPTSSGTAGYVEVQQGCPTTKNFNSSSVTTEGIGYQDYSSSCEGLYRSYFQLKTSNVNSAMDVTSATLQTQEVYGADETCSHTWPVTLKWTAGIGAATDWDEQPSVESTLSTEDPKTGWCGTQDVNFNVTSVMQTTAANNYAQWTFGLYGDESELGYASCSPSSEYNCGFMRFADNPTVTTVYDITPAAPTGTATTPAATSDGTATGAGCNGGTVGWIGATDLGSGNGSGLTLNATVTSQITGENVRAQFSVWDATMVPADGTDVVASPDSSYVASGTAVDTPVGIALVNGHQYGWDATAYDGTLTSAASPSCFFDVDTTAPGTPTVTSTAFPPSGTTGASPPAVGSAGSFSFASTDPVPTGCSATCLASGVAYYEYSFNKPLAASGNPTVQPGSALSYTATQWGTSILYAAAVDNAGNVSQPRQYDFYVAWTPQSAKVTAGDVNGDGIPDLLVADSQGNLLLYPGGTDPAVAPQVAGTPAGSPDGTGWNTFQLTHRGSMSQGSVDDLFVHKGANLWLYQNNPAAPGQAPQFGSNSVSPVTPKPGCAPTASDSSNCAGYDGTDWSAVTQILAPGDVFAGSAQDDGLPDLLTVENDQLWLYEGEFGDYVDTPVQLGSGGWDGMTLIAPGEVGGQLTLWARDNATGAVYSWPLTLDGNGVPELGTAAAGSPVTATSGTVLAGVTLTAAAYPMVASSGPLTGGNCASAATACPGLYAQDASGDLWYYQGEPVTGGASPLQPASKALLVGPID
jgi:hypothetical protein